jgi:hypothetical protein
MVTSVQVPKLVLVYVSAGASHGASGFGITPSGGYHKIPDNNPQLRKLASAAQALDALERAGNATAAQLKTAQTAVIDATRRMAAEIR